MNKIILICMTFSLAQFSHAGAGGILVKGVLKTWDEIAKISLKVSGKPVTEDAVRAASKTIEGAASRCGDDVAEAAMRGGIEVAEQSMKHGKDFVSIVRSARAYSDDAIRAVAMNSDDALKYVAKYGDSAIEFGAKAQGSFSRGVLAVERSGVKDVGTMLNVLAKEIPTEQIPQVVGVAERNPQVAKSFLDGVAKGGKYFLDKLFALNGKQIMAGGLTVAMIEVALGAREAVVTLTDPIKEQGAAAKRQHEKAMELVDQMDPEGKKAFINNELEHTREVQDNWVDVVKYPIIILSVLVGMSLFVFMKRKARTTDARRPATSAESSEQLSIGAAAREDADGVQS